MSTAATKAQPPAAVHSWHDVVFYDGHCGLCHHSVKFVLRHDRAALFRFAPLESDAFRAALPEERRRSLPDSVIVLTPDGRVLVRSSATVYILRQLGGGWRVCGHLLWLVPKPIRDLGYRAVASVRRKLFAPPTSACPLLPPELRSRFLH